MLRLLLAAVAVAAPSTPAPKPKAKERTFAAVIEKVRKVGIDRPVRDPSSRSLGFDADEVPAKAARFTEESSPDGREHGFYVILSSRVKPTDVIMTQTKIVERDGRQYVEGRTFRSDLKGNLISAFTVDGIPGEYDQVKANTNAAETRIRFAQEKDFYLKTMAGKEFDP